MVGFSIFRREEQGGEAAVEGEVLGNRVGWLVTHSVKKFEGWDSRSAIITDQGLAEGG